MQITLNQEEINAALEVYVKSQINIAENQEFSIDFNAGRSPNGPTATIDIRMRTTTAPVPETPLVAPKRLLTTGTPAKPAETVAEVKETKEAEPVAATESEEEVEDSAPEVPVTKSTGPALFSKTDDEAPAPERKAGVSIFGKAS